MADFDNNDFTPDPAPISDSAGTGGRMGQQGVPDDMDEKLRRRADEIIASQKQGDELLGKVPNMKDGRELTPVEKAELAIQMFGDAGFSARDAENAAQRLYAKSQEAEAKEFYDNIRQLNQSVREQQLEQRAAEAEAAAAGNKTKSIADMSDDEVLAYAAKHLDNYRQNADDSEAEYERQYGPGALQQLKRMRAQGLTEQQSLEQISDPEQREAAKRSWQARQDEIDYAAAIQTKNAEVIRIMEDERTLRGAGRDDLADRRRIDRNTTWASAADIRNDAASMINADGVTSRSDLSAAADRQLRADNRQVAESGAALAGFEDDEDPAPVQLASAAEPAPASRATVDATKLAGSADRLGVAPELAALTMEKPELAEPSFQPRQRRPDYNSGNAVS